MEDTVIGRYRGVRGLYVLLIELIEGYYRVGKIYSGPIPGGSYIYIGSAWGPGGLGARLLRHLRKTKKKHWHIDWITSDPKSSIRAIYLLPGIRGEANLFKQASQIGVCVITGFGSSDDPDSECHFLRLRTSVEVLEKVIRDFYPNYIKILL
jgi:Uri superfamily endonuclease